jgi:two-component system response regulator DesR
MCGTGENDGGLTLTNSRISVLYVDDNEDLAKALCPKLSEAGFWWRGHLPRADDLTSYIARECPDLHVLVLDLDMPGRDPFEALAEIVVRCPDLRVVVFSGYVRKELVDRAIEAGAWAYVSKNDGEISLLAAIREVVAGQFVLSPEAKAAVSWD